MGRVLVAAFLALLGTTAALAEEQLVGGHAVTITEDGMGGAALVVDGEVLHENGVIQLDRKVLVVDGIATITGVAGPGGNACNAAPLVLFLPEGEEPALYGPLDSCSYLPLVEVRPDAIVFAADPLPSQPGEVWVWAPETGFTGGTPRVFGATADAGWDQLDTLANAHPVDALALQPVLQALQSGLGADYPAFAERISELGSGGLTAEGYLGSACLKHSCEEDWAVLYLHRESSRVFAIWHVMGEIERQVWPQDTADWPPEAARMLRGG